MGGIMPHKLDIVRISISTKKAKLAWVTFQKARAVSDIFRLAVQNGNQTEFYVFPHVPAKAMARKEGLENILKRLQGENKAPCYQIRLGEKDLEVFVKNHEPFDYKPCRKIKILQINPNHEVPPWDLVSRRREEA